MLEPTLQTCLRQDQARPRHTLSLHTYDSLEEDAWVLLQEVPVEGIVQVEEVVRLARAEIAADAQAAAAAVAALAAEGLLAPQGWQQLRLRLRRQG